MAVEPTSATIPNKCTVSIAGNSHNESRNVADIGVFSSHWHHDRRSGIRISLQHGVSIPTIF